MEAAIIEHVEIAALVGVGRPLFGPQKILPGGDHRDADRGEKDRRHQVRAPAVVGRRLLAVVVGVLRDLVDPGAIVVRLGVVDRLRRP